MKNVIYKILDLTSFKMYIGSAVNFKDRKRCHLKDLRLNRHHSIYLQRVYNKYEEDNLQFSIIESDINNENLIEREQYWLDYFQPFGKKGFNSCKIAGNMLGFKHSELTKKLISEKQSSKIIQYSKEGVFIKIWSSVSEASLYYNVGYSTIGNSVNKNKLAVGYLWIRYEENYKNNINAYVKPKKKMTLELINLCKKLQKNASEALKKKIVDENENVIYNSIKDFIKDKSINNSYFYRHKNELLTSLKLRIV
jgi:group I intron endonuclease